jgi:hypothetical protein
MAAGVDRAVLLILIVMAAIVQAVRLSARAAGKRRIGKME